jgi:Pin2-interacting protein X1
MLLNKKTITKLGTQMNENAASKPSAFAMRQMEKMGWTEGKGLGKNETGISKHLSITKREESTGLGSEALDIKAMEETETWWHDAFASKLKALNNKIKDKKEKKSKSKDKNDAGSTKTSKKRKANDTDNTVEAMPSYADLFKATGGARLGMRARAEQTGKLKRTEHFQPGTTVSAAKEHEASHVASVESIELPETKRKEKKQKKVEALPVVEVTEEEEEEKEEEEEEEVKHEEERSAKKAKKEKKDKKNKKDK